VAGAEAGLPDSESAAADAYQELRSLVLHQLLAGGMSVGDGQRFIATAADQHAGQAASAEELARVGVDERMLEAARRLLKFLEHPRGKYVVDASQVKGLIVGDYGVQYNIFHPSDRPDLPEVADRLAIAVRRQWSYEATWRQLNDPYAMSVRWQPSDSVLVASWPTLVRLATSGPGWPVSSMGDWASAPADLAGAGNDLVDVLGRVPTGRLVVLGEPGAGKTILLVRMVLDLLSRRLPGQPVPVLMPLGSWDPEQEDLYTWIERWLTTDSPALAVRWPGGVRVSTARALLEACLLLPVLDGLDEMPEPLRGAAIARINDAMQPGQRLVLAARSDAFRMAVRPPGGVEVKLAGAAGIELCPLEANVVTEYLKDSAGGPDSAARWEGVVAVLASTPPVPVAQALTTPLMAALARAIYNPRPGESLSAVPRHPAELLDEELFPTRPAVEEHLFDVFIPAAYRPHLDQSRNSKWNADQAMRWLTFVARNLERRHQGTTDFAWWQLQGALPKTSVGLFVGLAAGVAGALTIPWRGWGIGVISAILVGLLVRKWIPAGKPGLARGLAGGLLGGQLAALVALAFFGTGVGNTRLSSFVASGVSVGIAVAPMSRFYVGLAGAFTGEVVIAFYERAATFDSIRLPIGSQAAYFFNGVGLGLAAGLAAGLFNRRTPARGLRWSRLGFFIGLGGGFLFGLVIWATAGPTVGLSCGAIAMIAGGLGGGLYEAAAPTDLTKATSPRAVLARDRATFLVSLALAFLVTLPITLATALSPPDPFNGPYHGIGYGIGIGIADLIAIGFGLAFFQALWGGFTLARCWLALSRRLPFRLMTFMNDAHTNRGVLRQVGAVYQFRHAELQRRLAYSALNQPTKEDAKFKGE
jgi:NACHT domain